VSSVQAACSSEAIRGLGYAVGVAKKHLMQVTNATHKFPVSDVRPLSPPPHVLPDPQKGAPLTELPQR